MRLTDSERTIIKQTAKSVFGPKVKVFLFGSRADISLKGGDIDLFIETQNPASIQDKITFLSRLKWDVGDQRIDVVVKSPDKNDREIYRIAKKRGIEI